MLKALKCIKKTFLMTLIDGSLTFTLEKTKQKLNAMRDSKQFDFGEYQHY